MSSSRKARERVLELLEWGANFDKDSSKAHGLAFTREGGHSFARILHAYGDATGKELAKTLIRTVRSRESIRVSENSFVIDLLTDDGRCLGVLALIDGQVNVIWAKRTILASGGAGSFIANRPTPRSPPPMGMRWPIAPAPLCRTWRWCSSIRRRSTSPARAAH